MASNSLTRRRKAFRLIFPRAMPVTFVKRRPSNVTFPFEAIVTVYIGHAPKHAVRSSVIRSLLALADAAGGESIAYTCFGPGCSANTSMIGAIRLIIWHLDFYDVSTVTLSCSA